MPRGMFSSQRRLCDPQPILEPVPFIIRIRKAVHLIASRAGDGLCFGRSSETAALPPIILASVTGMRTSAMGVLLVALVAGCGNSSHSNVKVKSLHGWEAGRAKHCMLLNGGSVVEGGKRVYVAKVEVDEKSEEVFRDTAKHFAVPLLCTRIDTRIFSCVYDGD
jgi:hypothetical protein